MPSCSAAGRLARRCPATAVATATSALPSVRPGGAPPRRHGHAGVRKHQGHMAGLSRAGRSRTGRRCPVACRAPAGSCRGPGRRRPRTLVVSSASASLRLAGARVEADADEPRVVAVDERHRAAVARKLAEGIGLQRLHPLLDLVGQVEVDVLVDGEAGEHGAPPSVGVAVAAMLARGWCGPLRGGPGTCSLEFLGREQRRELSSRADPELAVGVAEVHLDGLDGHEERLRDLRVARPVGREIDDPPLARRQRVEPEDSGRRSLAPVTRSSSRARSRGRDQPARRGEVERAAQRLARCLALAAAAQRRAELDQRAGELAARGRALELLDRLAQLREPLVAAEDQPRDGQRLPDVARRAPDARPAQRGLRLARGGRPRRRWRGAGARSAASRRSPDRAPSPSPRSRRASSWSASAPCRSPCAARRIERVESSSSPPIASSPLHAVEDRLRLVELAALDQHVDQAARADSVLPGRAGRSSYAARRRPRPRRPPLRAARSTRATPTPRRTRARSRAAAPRRTRSPPCGARHPAGRS